MSRPRYVRLTVDALEPIIDAKISPLAVLTYARIRLSSSKRSIPALLRTGPAGLAEMLGLELSVVRRQLRELAPFIILDETHRLIFAVGAVEQDPPTTSQALIGFQRQLEELPRESPVVHRVAVEVEHHLNSGAYDQLRIHWTFEPQASAVSNTNTTSESEPDSTPDSTPDRVSLRSPRSDLRDPKPAAAADPDAVAPYRLAWSRLPGPFAAAAAEELVQASQDLTIADFDALVRSLACSKHVSGQGDLKVTPTLRALLRNVPLRDRIIRGEFADRTLLWHCVDCGSAHPPSHECPPPCEGCQRHHHPADFCLQLRKLQLERSEADSPSVTRAML